MTHHESRPSLSTGNGSDCPDLCGIPSNKELPMTDAEWAIFYNTMMSSEDMLPLEDEE
jgi:hypothetical protein